MGTRFDPPGCGATWDAASTDPRFAHRWLLEVWLTRIRWAGVPLALALPLLFPVVAPWSAVALAVGTALANRLIAGVLQRGACPERLWLVRGLATALEWLVALSTIALRVRDADNDALIVLLLLVVLSGTRYRLRGVLAAAGGAVLVIGYWLGLQVFAFDRIDPVAAGRDLAEWIFVVGLAALVVAGQVGAGGAWFAREQARRADEQREQEAARRRDRARWADQEAELQRRQLQLTRREWEVLQLVTQGLDDVQIGAALSISPSTSKAHVYHISEKLGVTGRRAVADLARQQGWNTAVPEPPAPPAT